MDTVKNPYYDAIRYIIIVTGQSRHHSKWINIMIKTFFMFIMISFIICQITGAIKVFGNIDQVLMCIPPTCYASISAIIFINNNLRVKQINIVFWKIQDDWNTLLANQEVDILHKYGRKCRNYTMISIIGSFGHVTVYVFSHFIPLLIKVLRRSNESKEYVYLFEFGVNSEKYYYLISLHGYLAAYICTAAFVNGDTLLLMFLEHACGIFEIIRHKLSTAIQENSNSFNNVSLRVKLQQEIKLCVLMHKKLLLYVNDVQDAFSTAYLLVFGLSIIDLSITGVQFVMSEKSSGDGIRFGTYIICQVFHIFFLTLPTQHLLDKSLSLSSCIYNADWYCLSTKTRKLLLIIMERVSRPTTFIVGRIFILSLQFFTRVLQTSMSYFTVLMSVRG